MSGWEQSEAAARLRAAAEVEVREPPPLAAVKRVAASRARRNAQVMAFALALPLGAMAAMGGYVLEARNHEQLPLPRRGEGRGEGPVSALKERVAEEEALPVVTPPIELPPPSPPPARPALVKHVAAPLPSPSPLTPPEVTPEIPAVSGYAPPPAPLHTSLAEESAALTDALSTLRVKHEPAVALEKLAAYQQRFPAGALRHEAALATVEAHRALGHTAEALSALEQLPRRAELDVLRAELNAELGRCDAARAALKGLNPTGALRERAVFTDATCALTLGSRDEAKALLTGLPESARARELLEKLQP